MTFKFEMLYKILPTIATKQGKFHIVNEVAPVYDHYVSLNGTSQYIYMPDSDTHDVTGDIDMIVKVSSNDWTSTWQAFIGKGATGGNYAYEFGVNTSGQLELWLSQTGSGAAVARSNAFDNAAASLADGSTYWLRVTYDVSTTAAVFYKSTDYNPSTESGTWVTISTVFDGLSFTSIYAATGNLYLGVWNGNNEYLNGKLYYAEIRDGINGTIVARFNASETNDSGATFPNIDGEANWTNNGGIYVPA